MKSLSLYYKEENKRIAADMVVLFLGQKNMILEMKNPENQKWEYFPILSIWDNGFRGGAKTPVFHDSIIEMRFVDMKKEPDAFIEGKFSARISSIRILEGSEEYLLCADIVNGYEAWERLSGWLMK